MHGFHHLRERMRDGHGLEPFPARTVLKRFIDRIMYVVGILAPLALLPQIMQLYQTRSTAGLSLITWILVTIVNMLWALYGAVHKDKQIFYASVLMGLFDLTIVVGLLIY